MGHRVTGRVRAWPALLALVLAVPLVTLGTTSSPAAAVDGTGVLTLTKRVTGQTETPTHGPGDTFSYTLRIGCSNVDGPGCGDAQISDVLPAPLVLDPGATNPVQVSGVGTSYVVDTSGGVANVVFTRPLGSGEAGLQGGDEAVVVIQVQVPPDASPTDAGLVTNTARATQSNGQPRTASADVTIEIAEELEATVSKSSDSHTPSGTPVPAVPGQPVSWTLGGSNASNRGVDSLIVQDPVDGLPDSFQYLAVTGISTLTPPTGADRVQVDWRDDAGTWQTGSAEPIPTDPSTLLPGNLGAVHGLRFTFTSSTGQLPVTPAAGAAVITYETETRANVTTIPPNTTVTVTNTASSVVANGPASSDVVEDSASVQIRRQPPTVQITKDFEDPVLTSGESTTATLTIVNGATPVTEMVVSEPGAGEDDLADQGLTFEGFTGDLEWPPGATGAEIQYTYADGFTEGPRSATGADTLPAAAGGHPVAGFVVTFTGTMSAGATAILPFGVAAQRVDVPTDVTATNVATSQVTSSDGQQSLVASDSADLTRQPIRVSTTTSKNIVRDFNWAVTGASTLVSVPSSVAGNGPNGSTIGSQYLQITDPADPQAAPSEFWDHYDFREVAPTDIPANANLTVSYWDGSQWTAFPGASDVTGPVAGYTYTPPTGLRDAVMGIRFTFEPKAAGGLLPPGFSVTPYFRVALRDTLRSDPATSALPTQPTTFANDVQSEVHNPNAVVPTATADAQDSIRVLPIPPGGPGMIDKGWLLPNGQPSADEATVVALTDDQRTARLLWSTQDIPLQQVVIRDPALEPADTAASVFDAFDLVRVAPIADPLMTFDAVSTVERYSAASGSWVDITSAACPTVASCDGAFPGYVLSPAQQADTLGVRLTIVESPTRAARISGPNDPPVGSGVASSAGNDRPIDLVFQLRQQLRSDPSRAVLGTEHGYGYNTGVPGVVQNSVGFNGIGDIVYNSGAVADITILDRPVDVSVTKVFDQIQLGLPQAGTPPEDYPLVTAVLRAANESAGKVRTLEVDDPGPAGASPFDTLNLFQIDGISVPTGATGTDVLLSRGGTETRYDLAEALALTPEELADVTGVRVVHVGLIPNEAFTRVSLTFQLRVQHRGPPQDDVAEGERVANGAQASVQNPSGTATGTANDDLTVVAPEYSVTAGKTITPASKSETDARTGYTVALTGQPGGTVRTRELSITDTRATFWNAFDLAGFPANRLPLPVDQVRVDALRGVTYDLQDGELVPLCAGSADLTDCWVEGAWRTVAGPTYAATLPAGVTNAQVRGLRASFRRQGDAVWERPANPQVTFNFSATRRELLRYGTDGDTDTPVPSTRPDLDPAPGETVRGTITDQVDVHGTGAWRRQDDVWTAADSALATTVLRHLPNRISVTKSPGNGTNPPPEYAPATPIPYVLGVTNTGSWPMTGLDVRDHIATNETGSLLVWPRDLDGDPAPSFSVALVNGAGQSQPVTGFTVTLDEATGLLRLRTPAGFVLNPGWRLSVTADLIFQPGLEPGTAVVNDVTATSGRMFDTCTHTLNNRPNGSVGNVDACTSTTTTVPSAAAPIRAVKSVRGVGAGVPGATPGDQNFDDLGVIQLGSPGSATACANPNARNAFYAYPCVPITRAGGIERWQLSMTNQGNIPAGVLAGIDVLPAPGDTGVTVDVARLSAWRATLLGNFASNALRVDEQEKTFSIWITDRALNVACNAADIRNETIPTGLPTTDPCYAEVTNGSRGWTQVTASTTPAQLAAATAIKAVAEYADYQNGAGLAPGNTLDVTFETRTAAYAPQADLPARDAIAYNSFAVGARGVFADESQVTSVVEPRKVGVAMSSGRLDLAKLVDVPDGTDFPLPVSYRFRVACTSAGEDVPLRDRDGAPASIVELTPGEVLHYNGGVGSGGPAVNLPRYAECSLTELGSQGAEVTFDPAGTGPGTSGTITALRDYSDRLDVANPAFPEPIPLEQVTATNTYSVAGFTVSKSVDNGGAVDQDGTPIVYDETYDFTASCLFNDTEVVPADERTFSLADGESQVFDALPAGADCTVRETDGGTSASTTHVVTQDGTDLPGADGTTAELTLGADVDGAQVNGVAFTNHYTVGSLEVTKQVIGPGADPWNGNTFRILVSCTLGTAQPETVFQDDRFLSEAVPLWTVDDLPTGARCQVSEDPDNDGGASFTVLAPDDGVVTVGDGTTGEVRIANVFGLGAITVTKHVDGDTDEIPEALDGSYPISLACTLRINGQDFPIPVPGGADRVLEGDGGSVTYPGLPTRARCTVTETGSDPPAQATTITPDDGVVQVGSTEDDPVEVVVTNTFHLGSLRVTKSVSGPGADRYGAGPFQVVLSCVTGAVPVDIPGGAVRTLDPEDSPTTEYLQLPVGAECTLTETGAGGAQSTSIAVTAGEDPPVVTEGPVTTLVVLDDTASSGDGSDPGVRAAVDNRFDVGGLVVTKRVTGPGADRYGAGPFEVSLSCTSEVSGAVTDVEVPDGAERILDRSNAMTTTYADLPAGARCTLTETDTADASSTSISVRSRGVPPVVTRGTSADLVIGSDTGAGGAGTGVAARVVNRFDSTATDPGGADLGPSPGPSPSGPSQAGQSPSAGVLPGTGSDVPPWLPWLALLAVVTGAALVVGGRRRS